MAVNLFLTAASAAAPLTGPCLIRNNLSCMALTPSQRLTRAWPLLFLTTARVGFLLHPLPRDEEALVIACQQDSQEHLVNRPYEPDSLVHPH